jgi:hypothetical protein
MQLRQDGLAVPETTPGKGLDTHNFMIAKGLAPKPGTRSFVIMK